MFTVTFLADLKYRALPCNEKIRETHENDSRFRNEKLMLGEF